MIYNPVSFNLESKYDKIDKNIKPFVNLLIRGIEIIRYLGPNKIKSYIFLDKDINYFIITKLPHKFNTRKNTITYYRLKDIKCLKKYIYHKTILSIHSKNSFLLFEVDTIKSKEIIIKMINKFLYNIKQFDNNVICNNKSTYSYCLICTNKLKKKFKLNCGHCYCFNCLLFYYKLDFNYKCPICL